MSGLPENPLSMFAHDATVIAGIENGSVRAIPLTRGLVTVVDAEDYEWLNQWKWWPKQHRFTFYAVRECYVNGNRFHYRMHREILQLPKGQGIVDHADRNGLHNWKQNLRVASFSLNSFNRRINKNNTSGYRGVHWYPMLNKWVTQIHANGALIHCGYYQDLIMAAEAFDIAAIRYRQDKAVLNFPEKRSEYVSKHIQE